MLNLSQNETNFSPISNNLITKNILRVIIFLGIITNIICFFVFSEIIRKLKHYKGFMFKFLLTKSINDLAFFSVLLTDTILNSIIVNQLNQVTDERTYLIWKIYFMYFLSNFLMLTSGFLDITATLDCYINITGKLRWLRKKRYFYIQLVLVYAISITLNSFFIIKRDEIKVDMYTLSPILNAIKIIQNTFRDLITGILLISLNLLIFIFTRVSMKRKVNIQVISHNYCISQMSERIKQTDLRQIRMILLICLNYLLGHLPIFFFNFRTIFNDHINFLFYWIADIILMVSFLVPFFIYYYSNLTFSNIIRNKKNNLITSLTQTINTRKN
jgi:hypothetical protein